MLSSILAAHLREPYLHFSPAAVFFALFVADAVNIGLCIVQIPTLIRLVSSDTPSPQRSRGLAPGQSFPA